MYCILQYILPGITHQVARWAYNFNTKWVDMTDCYSCKFGNKTMALRHQNRERNEKKTFKEARLEAHLVDGPDLAVTVELLRHVGLGELLLLF